jgi:hypothetical protein
MAKDADGNYYYEEGTIAEQFDNWEVYEDSDGNVGLAKNGNEVRVHELAHLFGAQRAEPTTDELADGEVMMYVSDGSGGGAAGDFVVARNTSGTVNVAVLAIAGTDY